MDCDFFVVGVGGDLTDRREYFNRRFEALLNEYHIVGWWVDLAVAVQGDRPASQQGKAGVYDRFNRHRSLMNFFVAFKI